MAAPINYWVAARLTDVLEGLSGHEGKFTAAHTRVTTYAEQISFFSGESTEREIMNTAFTKVWRVWSPLSVLRMAVTLSATGLVCPWVQKAPCGCVFVGLLVLS